MDQVPSRVGNVGEEPSDEVEGVEGFGLLAVVTGPRALGVKTEREAEERSRAWEPWRAYAVMHLWGSLSGE